MSGGIKMEKILIIYIVLLLLGSLILNFYLTYQTGFFETNNKWLEDKVYKIEILEEDLDEAISQNRSSGYSEGYGDTLKLCKEGFFDDIFNN